MPRPSIERRRSPRYLCSHLVRVREGEERTGLLEDLSREGAGIALETALETGTELEVRAPGMRAKAKVRYCLKRQTDFRVGVEFLDDVRWTAEEWLPNHLFLPPPEP